VKPLGHVIQGPFIITDDDDGDGNGGPVIMSDGQMLSVMYRTGMSPVSVSTVSN